jgi:hypothetical protein
MQTTHAFSQPEPKTKVPALSEYQLHVTIAEWLRQCGVKGLVWFHPSNGELRTKRTAAKLQRMGVRAGVADFVFILPGGKAAFLEVKKSKTSLLSIAQKQFKQDVEALGCDYSVVRSIDEAVSTLIEWEVIDPKFARGFM